MSTAYKGTMYFSAGPQGWSESWLLIFPAQQSDMNPIMETLKKLALARTRALAQDVVLGYLTVREVNSATKRRVIVNQYNKAGLIAVNCADPDGALIVRFLDAGQFHFNLRPLRGLPKDTYTANDAGVPMTDPMKAGLKAFANQLIADSWGWMYQGTQTTVNITGVAGGAGQPAILAVTGTPFNGLTVGSHVQGRVKGVEGAVQLNGSFVGKVVDASHVSIPRVTAFSPYTAATGLVVLRGAPTFATVADYDPEGYDERKTGRPFFQQRGRKSARRSL